MIHEYKTVRLYYGNDFDQTVDQYIKDGWAVSKIWPFDGAGQYGRRYETPTVQKMQVIITFIRIKPTYAQRPSMKAATQIHSIQRITQADIDRMPVPSLEYYLVNMEVRSREFPGRMGDNNKAEMFMIGYSYRGIKHKTIFTHGSN